MKNIEFLIGYYEYNLFINNEHVFVFTDFDDYFNNENNLDDNLVFVVNDSVEFMIECAKNKLEVNYFDFSNNQKELILSLNNEELEEIKKQMYNVLKHVYN